MRKFTAVKRVKASKRCLMLAHPLKQPEFNVLKSLEQRLDIIEGQVNTTSSQVEHNQLRIGKLELDIKLMLTNESQCQDKMDGLQVDINLLQKETVTLQVRVDKIESDAASSHKKLHERIDSVEQDILALKQKDQSFDGAVSVVKKKLANIFPTGMFEVSLS